MADVKELKTKDLFEKTEDELKQILTETYKDSFSLKMQRSTAQLAQTHLIKQNKRMVARIKTILGQKSKLAS